MTKFDKSCGLHDKVIDHIKYRTKLFVKINLAPLIPDEVADKLFFEGRDTWTYTWELLENTKNDPLIILRLGVIVKLKKEFHYLEIPTRFKYTCNVKKGPDVYHPVITVRKEKG